MTPQDTAGGGGGRIAIWSTQYPYAGTFSVTNGVSYSACTYQGTEGTLVLGWRPPPGSVISIRWH